MGTATALLRGRPLKLVASLGVTVVLFVAVLPLVSAAPWSAVGAVLGSLTFREILGLTALWFAGLYAHTFVLTAALPKLTHRRALTLSLTGSAVSNVVPLGGALGIGLNYRMTRTWGFSSSSFALYTLVTNLWDVLTKLALPAVALVALLVAGDVARPQMEATAGIALAVLVILVTLVGVAIGSDAAATVIGRVAERAVNAVLLVTRRHRTVSLVPAVLEMRRESLTLVRLGWAQLSLGMVAYSLLQAMLLWTCLHLFGTTLTTPEIFAGYALERVLTIAVITPGGSGLAEVGITALLIAFGGTPVNTVAGVLLYRAFTFGLEIPVGATGLALWLWHHRRHGTLVGPDAGGGAPDGAQLAEAA